MTGEWTIEDVWASGDWPTEVAIYRIITAPTVHMATGIRIQVGMAAMHHKRPQADADACDAAWEERWGHTVASQKLGPMTPVYWTGD